MKVALFSLLLLTGCGAALSLPPRDGGTAAKGGGGGGSGGSGGAGGGSFEGLPLAGACSTLNARRCDYFVRCGLIEDSDRSRRDCQGWLLSTWCGPTRWPARITAGTLRYDARHAQSCADAWLNRACEDFENVPAACNRMLLANVPPLQACYGGYTECTESLVCRGAACPRSCQPLGAMGDACQFDSDCRSLLYCKRAVLVTGAGTCANLGANNAPCTVDEPCGPGLHCAAGRCIVPPTTGMPCAAGGICDDTAWCQFTPDGGVCANREGMGSRCTDDVQCSVGHLCQFGRCEPKVLGALHADCSDRQTCPLNSTCVGATPTALGKCEPPLVPNDPCIASDDCLKHLACAATDGGFALTCGPRQAVGGSCAVDRDCQLLSRCLTGVCVRLPMIGESCANEKACATGPCQSADGGALCVDRFGPGVRCAADSDCASGRCLNSMCLPGCAP